MSDQKTTEGSSPDDHPALLALAQVTTGGVEAPLPATADRARVREFVELLGLLPYGLDPATPSPEVKARVLARAGGLPAADAWAPAAPAVPERGFDEITLDGSSAADPVDATRRRKPPGAGPEKPAPAPPLAEASAPGPVPPNVVPLPPAPAAAGPERRVSAWWTPALAAMLALCMLGLAFLAGKVKEQNSTITRLTGDLEGLPIDDWSSFYDEFTHMKRRFHMVTAVARHAYPLKTVHSLGPDTLTDGVVYVCGNHQRWYLNVQGLEAPPPGEEYNLWFVTGQGMIHGGVVEVTADASSEMEAQTLPEGTHGFAITREPSGAPHDQPSGMMVLLAEESVSL